jgi:hypothetical protein
MEYSSNSTYKFSIVITAETSYSYYNISVSIVISFWLESRGSIPR